MKLTLQIEKQFAMLGMLLLTMFSSLSIYGQSPKTNEMKTTLFRCSSKFQNNKKIIHPNSTGENVEGPVCAEISINALRYGAEFGATITETAGPNLGRIFPEAYTVKQETKALFEMKLPKPAPSLDNEFRIILKRLDSLFSELRDLQRNNRNAVAKQDAALRSLKDFVIQSDTMFTNQNSKGVINLVNSDPFNNALDEARMQQGGWKNSDKLIDMLREIQGQLMELSLKHPANKVPVTADHCAPANIDNLGWTDWITKCNDSLYKQKLAEITQMDTEAREFRSDGEKAATIAKKLGVAAYWQTMSKSLIPDDFILQFEIDCPALFNKNRQTELKLVLTDRIPTFDLQPMTPTAKEKVLTVHCGSRFSISAGVALSGIPNTEFAIVKGTPTPPATTSTNRFGILSDPIIHPMPIAIAHARLHEIAEQKIAFHTSFGVGVNARSQASGGSSPEFLIGPSISFLRTIYVTGGIAIGKSTGLAGGFKVNDTVPTDVTAPQIISSYTTRWGFAVTFTTP
jgi:hypothetical protein